MKKKEIVEILKQYGVEATLRPRKATLERLLKEVQEESTPGIDGNPYTYISDGPMCPKIEPLDLKIYEDACKIEPKSTLVDHTMHVIMTIGITLLVVLGLALLVQ